MMTKVALFAFNGEPGCFLHVLLNALDMKARGYEVKVVIEGAAVKLVPDFATEGSMVYPLWQKCLETGLVDGVCKGCAAKLGTLESAQAQGLTLLDEMSGHPSIARYREAGFEVFTI